jgi:hypothetical protein
MEEQQQAQATQQLQQLPCGRTECVYNIVIQMINKMTLEVASRQNIQYPEQIRVAQIYYLTASTLAEACRRKFRIELKDCIESKEHKPADVSIDTFILLNQLKQDDEITPEYEEALFQSLTEMKPELKDRVETDRGKGFF